jgi:hypothetical protein
VRDRPPGVSSSRWPVPMASATSASPRATTSPAHRLLPPLLVEWFKRLATEAMNVCASSDVCAAYTVCAMASIVRLKLEGDTTVTLMLVFVSAPSSARVALIPV